MNNKKMLNINSFYLECVISYTLFLVILINVILFGRHKDFVYSSSSFPRPPFEVKLSHLKASLSLFQVKNLHLRASYSSSEKFGLV